MPPKRKRVVEASDEERATKRVRCTDLTLDCLPDDCLLEILRHMPPLSVCAASLTSKRLNNVFEALILKDLSKILGTSFNFNKISQAQKQSLSEMFYPRAQYLAFERLIDMEAKNDDKGLEKLLDRLHNWSVLKISEQLNNRELKTKLSDKLLQAILGRFGYKEISPVNTFTLWDGTDGYTYGGTFHVSFFLFGQNEHFVEVSCDVYCYYEHPGGNFACKLEFDATLFSCTSNDSVAVKGLLEGYPESCVPQLDSDAQINDDYLRYFDQSGFLRGYLNGDRVRRKWFHDCYPKLNKEKIDQVKEWLGWDMSTLELAQVLAGLSMEPSVERKEHNDKEQDIKTEDPDSEPIRNTLNIDTSDTKASLELLLKNVHQESKWLYLAERTLALLAAKIKLKNRVRRSSTLNSPAQLIALIDRSMYTEWTHMKGCFKTHSDLPDVDPNFRVYYHRVKGEIKLIAEDPSKWLRVKFTVFWGRKNPDFFDDDKEDESNYAYSVATSTEQCEKHRFYWEPWAVPDAEVKLFQDELGLKSFTSDEITELLGLIADLSHVCK